MRDINLPDISWKYNAAERKQSRRFLECVENKFLTQLASEPARGGALLDLLFTNREALVGDVEVGGCLGFRDQEIKDLLVRGEVKQGASRITTIESWRADFGPFGMLVKKVPWEKVLKGKGVQAGWTFFKEEVFKATQAEEYRNLIRSCREENRKAKAQLKLRLATLVSDNQKCFYKYTNNSKRAKENLQPFLDVGDKLPPQMRKRLRYLMTSLFQSLIVRPILRRVVSPQSWNTRRESRINLP